jgi:hypothetical protein
MCFLTRFLAYSGTSSANEMRGCSLERSGTQWCLVPHLMSGGNTDCGAICF